jgi:hypothetical protein
MKVAEHLDCSCSHESRWTPTPLTVAPISLGTIGTHPHSRSAPPVLIIKVARHLDRRLSILPVAADPTEALPLLSCSIRRTGYYTSRNTGRRRYAGTHTSLPVDRHGHRHDFSMWTFTRQHRGRRYADSTRTPSLPGRMLSLHKRRHVTVCSPVWVFAEIRCYPSPARSGARQPS